jgi:hypothetical protein
MTTFSFGVYIVNKSMEGCMLMRAYEGPLEQRRALYSVAGEIVLESQPKSSYMNNGAEI